MKPFALLSFVLMVSATAFSAGQPRPTVMNPGEAIGQLVFLSSDDVKNESPKYKSLSPLSIPVFAELPLDLSVVAGAITLQQQNLLSHVQLKSRARLTPNLDVSTLPAGMKDPSLATLQDGAWVRMVLGADGAVLFQPATESQATESYNRKKTSKVELQADVTTRTIFRTEDLRAPDFVRVGSKAANYGELARTLNSASRTVVRPGFGIPFAYYDDFINQNPKVKAAIQSVLRDPLMAKVAKVEYREAKLKAVRELMMADDALVDERLVNDLISRFDQIRSNGLPRSIKLRSSTNSEDLPNFNGAGLYECASYKPVKKKTEKSREDKIASLKKALRFVWASVWNLRAFDERAFFRIPHADVKMGLQANPSFGDEGADGVVVTKNIANDSRFPGSAIYVEVQRGSQHSVANPEAGVKPQKVLVNFDAAKPLEAASYKVHVLQNSNIADDGEAVLGKDNPAPVLSEDELKDLTFQVLKAQEHFRSNLGKTTSDFALDLEFKIDSEDTGRRQIYIKQARPYLN